MTIPSLLFGLLISLLIGSLYHLVRGGRLWRFILYLMLSGGGFVIGHLVGQWRGWVLFPFGSLDLGASSLGSVLLLLVGDWLRSRIEYKPESTV